MTVFAQTDRFILRTIEEMDLDGMYALDSDPMVHKYLGKKPVSSKSKMEEIIKYIRKQYVDYGVGRWAVIHKPSNEFMGWSGLKMNFEKEMNGHRNFYDIGYRFRPQFWGKGYATETGKLALDYAFNTLNLETMYGMAELENAASRKVLCKLGLQYKGDFLYEEENIPLAWYEINNPNNE